MVDSVTIQTQGLDWVDPQLLCWEVVNTQYFVPSLRVTVERGGKRIDYVCARVDASGGNVKFTLSEIMSSAGHWK